jgi:C_GCAxxG_C_C family probable redox protein
MNRGKILDQVQRLGYKFEEDHHGCAQCTILALQEVFNEKNEELFKALSGFGFGIARMYSVCGALIAGGLFLGTKYGRGYTDLKEPQDIKILKLRAAYEPVGRLYKWVEKEFGSVTCREIRKTFIGVDLDPIVPWQMEMAIKLGVGSHCCQLVGKVARKTAELILTEDN